MQNQETGKITGHYIMLIILSPSHNHHLRRKSMNESNKNAAIFILSVLNNKRQWSGKKVFVA